MVVLLMSRMTLPLSAPLWQQNGNYSICKLGEVLTWGFFGRPSFSGVFFHVLFAFVWVSWHPVMLQCFLLPAVELLDKGCGELYSLLECLSEEL